jgi:hypothetical protein
LEEEKRMKREFTRARLLLAVSAFMIGLLPAACAVPPTYETIYMGTPYGKAPYVIPHMQALEVDRLYRFDLSLEPSQPVAGQAAEVTLSIFPADGQPLLPPAENMIHFVVASVNLADFHSIQEFSYRPLTGESGQGGRYTFPVTFKLGGSYSVTAIFLDRGFEINKVLGVEVAGPEQKSVRWNFDRIKEVDGIEVSLTLQTMMRPQFGSREFIVELSQDGQRVLGLKPYLGAFGHMTIFRQTGREVAHVHGNTWRISQEPEPGRMAVTGPKLYFPHNLYGGGKYRLVVQFRRGEKQYTIPFDVSVRSYKYKKSDRDDRDDRDD